MGKKNTRLGKQMTVYNFILLPEAYGKAASVQRLADFLHRVDFAGHYGLCRIFFVWLFFYSPLKI